MQLRPADAFPSRHARTKIASIACARVRRTHLHAWKAPTDAKLPGHPPHAFAAVHAPCMHGRRYFSRTPQNPWTLGFTTDFEIFAGRVLRCMRADLDAAAALPQHPRTHAAAASRGCCDMRWTQESCRDFETFRLLGKTLDLCVQRCCIHGFLPLGPSDSVQQRRGRAGRLGTLGVQKAETVAVVGRGRRTNKSLTSTVPRDSDASPCQMHGDFLEFRRSTRCRPRRQTTPSAVG
jgi:hypothetical protein